MLDIDRRGGRTRNAIRVALFELLAERGFAKLTVGDVVNRANIGRSTFYEHYRTKHDLLRRSFAGPFGVLASIIGNPTPPETLQPLLQHFRANQALARELFLSRSTRLLMSRALAEQIEAKLIELCATSPDAEPLIPLGLIGLQLADAQLCLIEAWALGRASCGIEGIAAALSAGSHGSTMALLGLDASRWSVDR